TVLVSVPRSRPIVPAATPGRVAPDSARPADFARAPDSTRPSEMARPANAPPAANAPPPANAPPTASAPTANAPPPINPYDTLPLSVPRTEPRQFPAGSSI